VIKMKILLILVLFICLAIYEEIEFLKVAEGEEYVISHQESCTVLSGIWNMSGICIVSNLTIKEGDTLQILQLQLTKLSMT